jgi:hypothetical protein
VKRGDENCFPYRTALIGLGESRVNVFRIKVMEGRVLFPFLPSYSYGDVEDLFCFAINKFQLQFATCMQLLLICMDTNPPKALSLG